MTDTPTRLEAAVAELVAAIREEVRAEVRTGAGPPVLLSVDQAAERVGIGRTALYGAIARGEIRSVKVGRRRLIPASAIEEMIWRDPYP